jgi:predicted transcriptional regulator
LPTPGQIRAARGLLNLTQADLASVAGVSLPTVKRFESGRITPETGEKIRAALEASGVEFIPENGGGAGVRLKQKG